MCGKLVGTASMTLGSEVEPCRVLLLDKVVDGERMV